MIDMAGITVSSYIYTVCKTSTIGFQCDPRTRIIYYCILYTEKFFCCCWSFIDLYIGLHFKLTHALYIKTVRTGIWGHAQRFGLLPESSEIACLLRMSKPNQNRINYCSLYHRVILDIPSSICMLCLAWLWPRVESIHCVYLICGYILRKHFKHGHLTYAHDRSDFKSSSYRFHLPKVRRPADGLGSPRAHLVSYHHSTGGHCLSEILLNTV